MINWGEVWQQVSPLIYVLVGGGISILVVGRQLRADQRSRFHDQILSRVADALDVYRTLEIYVSLPEDDEPTKAAKERLRLQQMLRIKKIKDELTVICLSADLPIAVDRAFNAYFGYSQSSAMPPYDTERSYPFKDHDKMLREAHHELGIKLERRYTYYPRGIVIGEPVRKRWWQVWKRK